MFNRDGRTRRVETSDGVTSLLTATHFSKGTDSDIAFVLSCPGRLEEVARHPAAGTTGKNLERLLELLGPHLGLSTLSRSQIAITNAWAGIEYQGKTGRSEASDGEVTHNENIQRLAHELRHIKMLVVFCGEKAKLASFQLRDLNLLDHSVQLAFVAHLGNRGLSRTIKSDVAGHPIVGARKQRQDGRPDSLKHIQAENTSRRLEVVVKRLLCSRVPIQ